MHYAEFRTAARHARQLRSGMTDPSTERLPRRPAGSLVPDWLKDWDALKAEFATIKQNDPYRMGQLLYPALKLAPATEEGAFIINCCAYARTVVAANSRDLTFAIQGFRTALTYTTKEAQQRKIRVNLAGVYHALGSPRKAERISAELYTVLPPDDPMQFPVRYGLGFAWAAQGKFEQAYRAFESAAALAAPGSYLASATATALATVAFFLARDDAMAHWLSQVPADQQTGGVLILQAYLQLRAGQLTEAALQAKEGLATLRRQRIDFLNRHTMALGYQVLAACTTEPLRQQLQQVAAHFAGAAGVPVWYRLLCEKMSHLHLH